MVTDLGEDAIFYHIVAKEIAVTYISLFHSILKNAVPDFFYDYVVYNASELGTENFCINARALIKNHDDRICCHVFPNAINCRFMEALHLSKKEGRFGSKPKTRRAKRMGNSNIVRKKTIVSTNQCKTPVTSRPSQISASNKHNRP
jgi:hypothetical protein